MSQKLCDTAEVIYCRDKTMLLDHKALTKAWESHVEQPWE